MATRFRNRFDAGQVLAGLLRHHADDPEAMVLALPRGGVPVGYEVARILRIPLDVFVVRKLGLRDHPEFAIGAIASGGVRVLNEEAVKALNVSDEEIEDTSQQETMELERREAAFRGDRPPLDVRERHVILVDDGLATGSTMRAAVAALRQQPLRAITVAVPVAAADSCHELRAEVDEIVCVRTPEPFVAVGLWYDDFTQTTDTEVRHLLEEAAHFVPADRTHVHTWR
jgi:predicted phosphoribosyltransferase